MFWQLASPLHVVYCKIWKANIASIAPAYFSEYSLFCYMMNGGCTWLWTKSGLVAELMAQDRCRLCAVQMLY